LDNESVDGGHYLTVMLQKYDSWLGCHIIYDSCVTLNLCDAMASRLCGQPSCHCQRAIAKGDVSVSHADFVILPD
jgi:hypothetical protein